MERNDTNAPSVQSITRVFAVLEQLAAVPEGQSLLDISRACGLAKSTTHRLLANLLALGYAVQDSATGHYRLTLKLFELSGRVAGKLDIVTVARPFLDALSRRTGETVHLVLRDHTEIVYLYKAVPGVEPLPMSSRIGLRSPLYCTGVGKAILADCTADEVNRVWEDSAVRALTPYTITDRERLRLELAEIRRVGYALDNEENELGIRCVAISLPATLSRPAAAFSISGLAPQMTDRRVRELADALLDTRRQMAPQLGLAAY